MNLDVLGAANVLDAARIIRIVMIFNFVRLGPSSIK